MRRLSKNIRYTLFAFLSIFALLVNAIAFYILTDYNRRHYEELAEAHMEQQYQNCQQRLAVLGEQVRSFGENAQLINEIAKQDWAAAGQKVGDFIQSSGSVLSVGCYRYIGGRLEYVKLDTSMRFSGLSAGTVLGIWDKMSQEGGSAVWFLRESVPGKFECLSYLLPLYEEEGLLGFLIADISVISYMEDVMEEGASSLWEESIVLRGKAGSWFSEGAELLEWERFEPELGGVGMRVTGNEICSARTMVQSEIIMLQKISMKLGSMYLSVGSMFMLIFLASLLFVYLGIRFLSASIMEPLEKLERNMKKTTDQLVPPGIDTSTQNKYGSSP